MDNIPIHPKYEHTMLAKRVMEHNAGNEYFGDSPKIWAKVLMERMHTGITTGGHNKYYEEEDFRLWVYAIAGHQAAKP